MDLINLIDQTKTRVSILTKHLNVYEISFSVQKSTYVSA